MRAKTSVKAFLTLLGKILSKIMYVNQSFKKFLDPQMCLDHHQNLVPYSL